MRQFLLIILLLCCITSQAQGPMMKLIRHTAAVGYDPDAQSYIDRVETALGGSLTTPEKDAINTYVVGLKNNSLWGKIVDRGLMIGGTAATHAETLKGVNDITWNGTVTHSATGSVSNGTNGYGNTGINGSTALTLNNSHVAIYLRTNTTEAIGDIGASSSTTSRVQIFPRSSNLCISDHNSSTAGAGRISAANTNSSGYYISSRVSATDYRVFKNGSQLGSTATTTNNGTFPNLTITIMGVNVSGTVSAFTTREVAMWSVGESFTPSEAAIDNTLTEALQDALSRGVQ